MEGAFQAPHRQAVTCIHAKQMKEAQHRQDSSHPPAVLAQRHNTMEGVFQAPHRQVISCMHAEQMNEAQHRLHDSSQASHHLHAC